MKTIDEVKKHLVEVGYDNETIFKITGFLTGAGLKEDNETIIFKKGHNGWDRFKSWYDKEEKVLSYHSKVIVDSLEDLISYLNHTTDIPLHLLYVQTCFQRLISSIKRSEEIL